jgi:hypothetical protein
MTERFMGLSQGCEYTGVRRSFTLLKAFVEKLIVTIVRHRSGILADICCVNE